VQRSAILNDPRTDPARRRGAHIADGPAGPRQSRAMARHVMHATQASAISGFVAAPARPRSWTHQVPGWAGEAVAPCPDQSGTPAEHCERCANRSVSKPALCRRSGRSLQARHQMIFSAPRRWRPERAGRSRRAVLASEARIRV